MKRLISALFLVTGLAAGSALAQPYAPNAAGVTMGHWHLNSRDVQANKKIFVAMGGVPSTDGPRERVTFPGVVINLNLGAANPPPPTGGTVGSVVNHVGFIVKSVPESVAKWKAAGVAVEPGNNGRLDQAYVTTPDGLRIEILENKNQPEAIRHEHVHFFVPEAAVPEIQAGMAKSSAPSRAPRPRAQRSPTFRACSCASTRPPRPKLPPRDARSIISASTWSIFRPSSRSLKPNGIKLDRPYTKNEQTGAALAFITDPWGTYIELNQRPNAVYLP